MGTVTSLIPPNYGIVDGDAFYVNAVVVGSLPQVRRVARHCYGVVGVPQFLRLANA